MYHDMSYHSCLQSERQSNSAGLLGAGLIIVISGQWQSTVTKKLVFVSLHIIVPVANMHFSSNTTKLKFCALSVLVLGDCSMSYMRQHVARYYSKSLIHVQ